MDITKLPVIIKGYEYAAWYLMVHGTDLVRNGRFVECFEFINDEFFSDMERTMGDVVEPLTAFEERCK